MATLGSNNPAWHPFANISPTFRGPLVDLANEWDFHTDIRILIVVDEELSTMPGQGFGVGNVVKLLNGMSLGSIRFNLDIAVRNGADPAIYSNAPPYTARYIGFRFDMRDGADHAVDRYQQIWCFGFKPDNAHLDDADIEEPRAFPASDSELAVLARWMDENQGGLFGTGDHHTLGASMCHRIPRLRTMRRWTGAGGVPPQFSPDRIDTLRPPSDDYLLSNVGGPSLDPMTNEEDTTVQPIQLVAWDRGRWPVAFHRRPHPILCHPTLGPINVMPDHPHEGLCVENVPLDGSYDFDGGGAKPEYPDAVAGGEKPRPRIIAYGSTLGHPPYRFGKGPQPARPSFPMLSVYDGHKAGVGRVFTDSTWHHWFDMNIVGIQDANTREWQLIRRFFINVALWLNPPGIGADLLYLSSMVSFSDYPGLQEYRPGAGRRELGLALKSYLSSIYGPCWLREVVFEGLRDAGRLPPLADDDDTDVPGMDAGYIENIVLGTIVEQLWEPVIAVRQLDGGKTKPKLPPPNELFRTALAQAADEIADGLQKRYQQLAAAAQAFSGR